MNERIRSILTAIIKNPDIKMAALTRELDLTRRQINYALGRFNESLAEKHLPLIERNHNGDFRIPREVIQLVGETKPQESSSESWTENERAGLLLAFLITHVEYVSVNHLIDFLQVSKTTLSEDLKKAEWLADSYHLSIRYNRMDGYQLLGHENRVLQLGSDLVKHYALFTHSQLVQELAPNVDPKMTRQLIHDMEQMLHLNYSDESFSYLQTVLPLFLERAWKKGDRRNFFRWKVDKTPEFRILRLLLAERGWNLPESYVEWIALLFLTSNISQEKTTQEFDSDQVLRTLITEMVDRFERKTLISIDDRETFERQILGHLRPACFRVQYDLGLGRYSLQDVLVDSRYQILLDLMKHLIEPTENYLGKAFPNDELELLSYYFGSQLSAQIPEKTQKYQAVVVCTSGVVASKLLRESLQKLFPEVAFSGTFSARDFQRDRPDADFVFSTIPLKTERLQFVVHPIMNESERIHLRARVLEALGIQEEDQALERLLSIIRKHTSIRDGRALRTDLQYFLLMDKEESPLEPFRSLPSLTHYLKPSYITLIEEPIPWEEAVKKACQPLIDDRIVSEEFFLDCVRQIGSPQYAGYLGRQTVIPHTTVEHGVLRDGISLLISRKAIQFPEGQERFFVLPLSFYDLTRHLKALNQIVDLSNDDLFLEELKQQTDVKSAYQMIRKAT